VIAVIDTNVPVVANGQGGDFPGCVVACLRCLIEFRRSGVLVLDDGWRIIREYMGNLRSSGQPGVGDAFLKWVLTNWANPTRCCLVAIAESGSGRKDFAEFPADPRLAEFDPDDRKFVAVARAHPQHPPILQALDSEWWHCRETLAENQVDVTFLCPAEIAEIDDGKRRSRR